MLKPLAVALGRIATDLEAQGVRFALVGGLAVGARTQARFTSDVDLVVAVASDRQAEALVRSLLTGGYRLVAQLEHLDTDRFATVRLLPPPGLLDDAETPLVDLLFATAGIEDEIVSEAEAFQLDAGLTVRVARAGHLIALKLLAQHPVKRPQDSIDALRLASHATTEEFARARTAVRQITERGYARDKRLEAELDALIERIRTLE